MLTDKKPLSRAILDIRHPRTKIKERNSKDNIKKHKIKKEKNILHLFWWEIVTHLLELLPGNRAIAILQKYILNSPQKYPQFWNNTP